MYHSVRPTVPSVPTPPPTAAALTPPPQPAKAVEPATSKPTPQPTETVEKREVKTQVQVESKPVETVQPEVKQVTVTPPPPEKVEEPEQPAKSVEPLNTNHVPEVSSEEPSVPLVVESEVKPAEEELQSSEDSGTVPITQSAPAEPEPVNSPQEQPTHAAQPPDTSMSETLVEKENEPSTISQPEPEPLQLETRVEELPSGDATMTSMEIEQQQQPSLEQPPAQEQVMEEATTIIPVPEIEPNTDVGETTTVDTTSVPQLPDQEVVQSHQQEEDSIDLKDPMEASLTTELQATIQQEEPQTNPTDSPAPQIL